MKKDRRPPKKKQKDRGPQLSLRRAKYVGEGKYISKLVGQNVKNKFIGSHMRDGKKFTDENCLRCKKPLTRKEFDRLGLNCWDCY